MIHNRIKFTDFQKFHTEWLPKTLATVQSEIRQICDDFIAHGPDKNENTGLTYEGIESSLLKPISRAIITRDPIDDFSKGCYFVNEFCDSEDYEADAREYDYCWEVLPENGDPAMSNPIPFNEAMHNDIVSLQLTSATFALNYLLSKNCGFYAFFLARYLNEMTILRRRLTDEDDVYLTYCYRKAVASCPSFEKVVNDLLVADIYTESMDYKDVEMRRKVRQRHYTDFISRKTSELN